MEARGHEQLVSWRVRAPGQEVLHSELELSLVLLGLPLEDSFTDELLDTLVSLQHVRWDLCSRLNELAFKLVIKCLLPAVNGELTPFVYAALVWIKVSGLGVCLSTERPFQPFLESAALAFLFFFLFLFL